MQQSKPQGRYLLNTNSKKIHDMNMISNRCRVNIMREEYKKYFATLEEALTFPTKEHPLAKPCAFCIGENIENMIEIIPVKERCKTVLSEQTDNEA